MNERPNWMMGIRIPPGKLEEVTAYVYGMGCELTDFAPEFKNAIERMTQAMPLPNGEALAITDQTGRKKRRPRTQHPTEALDPSTCKGFILKSLRRSPKFPRDLKELATTKGVSWDVKGVDVRLAEMKAKGWVLITPKGWDLTEEGRKISKQTLGHPKGMEAQPPAEATNGYRHRASTTGKKTQVEVVEAFAEAAYPRHFAMADLRDEFVKWKFRRESSATAVHFLKTKGILAAGAEAAQYIWIPPEKRTETK